MGGFEQTMDLVAAGFEALGVLVIVAGLIASSYRGLMLGLKHREGDAFEAVRATFGRSVLLGLEVLVAGDIIRTVAVDPTMENLAVLAVLVLIRTFLSWSLEVEIEGRWPWQAVATRQPPCKEPPDSDPS